MPHHTYDEFPYLCLIRPDIHPAQLATLTALFTESPPLLDPCRILELGCGNGIKLIAIAQSLPRATCLGIDYSAKQIEDGQKIIQETGLNNITLQHLNILEFDDSFGLFDYILIHGVYSWVPKQVRDKLLSICHHHLAPRGIAYLSYNTYPGWYCNRITREMLQYYHQQQFKSTAPIDVSASQQLLELATILNKDTRDAYTFVLEEQHSRLLQHDVENYLRHDLLEEVNHPFYFYQFLEHIKAYKLDYVTDVKFRDLLRESQHHLLSASPLHTHLFTDFFTQEQYLDFFFGRKLRMSVICHQGMSISRRLDSTRLTKFYLAATPQLRRYAKDKISSPLIQVAIHHLTEIYPHDIFFKDLLNHVCTHLSLTQGEWTLTLASDLLDLYCSELIELKIYPSQPFMTQLSTFPMVSPLARWQACHGHTTIVNLLGQIGQLDAFTCQLLPHLNGKNDYATLLKIVAELVTKNSICLEEPNIALDQLPEQEREHILSLYLENVLAIISRYALLVG